MLRNAKEATENRQEMQYNIQTLERDQRELYRFMDLVNEMEEAVKRRELRYIPEIKSDLMSAMDEEIAQMKVKTKVAKREVQKSGSEKRSNNREIRSDRRDAAVGIDKRDDRRDLSRDRRDRRDDRRDKRDDVGDLNDTFQRLEAMERIKSKLEVITLNQEPSQEKVDRTISLLDNFLVVMKSDLNATKEEIKEDKGEIAEDRRERFDDRRERREVSVYRF